ncbi:SUMO-interacting motif-containing protein 1 [Leptodactylus fuscus]
MDEVISLLEDSEEDEQTWQRRSRRKRRRHSASPTQVGNEWVWSAPPSREDIIDLTGNSDTSDTSSEDAIDLTSPEDDSLYMPSQQQTNPEDTCISSLSEDVDLVSDVFSYPMAVASSCNGDYVEFHGPSSSNSSLCSAESITEPCQPDDGLPAGWESHLPSESNTKPPYVNSSHLEDRTHQAIHNPEPATQVQHITSSTTATVTAMWGGSEPAPCSQSAQINSPLLYKLRYFKKPPVSHMFSCRLRHDKSLQPAPMPLSRMNIVNNTRDENFHQGTLYFLSEFTTTNLYPPKDIVGHVIRSILLGAEEQTTRQEAYMVLMKVQRLHPATSESVAWDWDLLSEVMSKQPCPLFLQYVVQTLDDDFHLCLQRRTLHRCLCRSMLSCDKSFGNVKQVIDWLIDAVKLVTETGQDSLSQSNLQRIIYLLQRMLSIAVDVDNSPTMTSNKMADYIFPYVTILKTRQQREMFFKSTENGLLRAKILEVIFDHGCLSPPVPNLSLSLGKILHFLTNSTLQLESQGPDWERWDEMLHHIITLCLSLQTIVTDHLRTPIGDRTDEILKRPQLRLRQSEDITESEVDISLARFRQRTCLGAEPAAALLHRLFLLRSLLQTAVKR